MLSVPHLIIVFLVALLVFGPEKLPELARTLSKAMGEFHRLTGDFQETLQREMRQLENETSEQSPGKWDIFHSEPAPSAAEEAAPALPEAVSPDGEIQTEAGEPVPVGSGPEESEETRVDDSPASRFEGLRYDDASYLASVANRPNEESAGQTFGAVTAEGAPPNEPAAHDSAPEAGNSSSEDTPPLAGSAENPVNDHPTAA